jgi:hypothetical protein
MSDKSVDVALLLLASPIYGVLAVRRLIRKWRFLRVASATSIRCECGMEVPLVGLWRCGCGFVARSHLLSLCALCGHLPAIARCRRCGVTTKLPEP